MTTTTISINISGASYTILWHLLNVTNIDHWDLVNEANIDPVNKPVCVVMNLSALQFHDESKDLIDAKTSNICINVIRTVVYPVLFFIGFPSNLVNLLVFFKHGLRQRINLCLFCLALADIIFVSLSLLIFIKKLHDNDLRLSSRTVGYVLQALINSRLLGLYAGAGYSSQFISAVIAGERCLCVVWPLRSSAILKTKTIGAVLLVGVLLITGLRLLVSIKYDVMCVKDAMTGLESVLAIGSQFYMTHKKLVDIVDGLVFSLGLNVTCCIFVIITTAITVISLQKSTQFQKESSSSATSLSARNIAVTKMLIYLSIQYIVLTTPNILFRVSLAFLPELNISGNWANLFLFLLSIADLFAVISSSLNFVIYYFFGSKYRETVLEML